MQRDTNRTPGLGWWILITVGLASTGAIALHPALAEPLALIPGVVDQGLVLRIFMAAMMSHALQAGTAGVVAMRTRESIVRWTVQTFVLGIPSTRLLFALAKWRGVALLSASSFLLPLTLLVIVRSCEA